MPDPESAADSDAMPDLAACSRLFVAIVPPAAIATALHARCAALLAPHPYRCVAPERLHLTLLFLGAVAADRLAAVTAAVCLPFTPFELQLGTCEPWSHDLVVVRPATVPPSLTKLRADLTDRLTALRLTLRTDPRPFTPHLTVARRRLLGRATGLPSFLRGAAATHPPATWTVSDYSLCESLPGPPAVYRAVRTCRSPPGLTTSAGR